jgi:hypothetical protein
MARPKKVPCSSCDTKVLTGTSFCPSCEHPMPWASVEERREWELAQWRKKRTTVKKQHAPARSAELPPRPSKGASAPKPIPSVPVSEPIRTVPQHKTMHTAAAISPPSAPIGPTDDKTAKKPPAVREVAVSKEPKATASAAKKAARARKKETSAEAAPGKAPKTSSKAAAKAAPKMAPMTVPSRAKQGSHAHGNGNGVEGNGNGARDASAEQTEILRELLRRVIAIEEKMHGNGGARLRRLRLLKR